MENEKSVAIIGGGVIGSFIARELRRFNIPVYILEKNSEICSETSKANSGIVHAGFDAPVGSQKAFFNVQGNALMEPTCDELDVPFKRNGSLILAFSEEEMKTLEEIYERGKSNGVPLLSLLHKEEVQALEPNLSQDVVGALSAGTGGIVCPFRLTLHAMENAVENGATLYTEQNVCAIEKNESGFTITTDKTTFHARYVINASGVYADQVAALVGDTSFSIYPRRGEYMLYDKKMKGIVSHTLFHTPTKLGKGILVTPTVDGNLLIGPNALNAEDKSNKETTSLGLDAVWKGATKSVPSLSKRDIITSFTGLRAISDTDDFIIGESAHIKGFINVAGIQSPGLSSAPAIGRHVAKLISELEGGLTPNESFNPTIGKKMLMERVTSEELHDLITLNPAYGNIICRCETVSEGEIIDAIHAPNGATTVDGVKRRTRAGAGRCQGGFCMPKVMEILSRERNVDFTDIRKNDDGSYILIGKTKEMGVCK